MNKKITTSLLATLLTTSTMMMYTIPVYAENDTEPPSNESGTPPEKPDGDNGEVPEKPEGDSDNQPPEMGDGQAPQGGGANTQTFDYSGSYSGTVTASGSEESSSNETLEATSSDQNVVLAQDGGTLTIDNDTLNKSGDDTNGDNCNFYGLNSISLTVGSESLTKISNSQLNATSEGSNAIFAADNSKVYAYKDTIETSAGNSRGLDATYGGTIIADSMTIGTSGEHSASVATDRGGGNVSVTNSSLYTEGSGSPLLYSTGDIEADNVTGTASGSQIAGMEGLNNIYIYNSQLSSTNNAITGSDPIKNGVIIYQSTSGDADTSSSEKAKFETSNSILSTTIDSGSMFYVTNTEANIVLSSTLLSFDSDNVNLLQVEGNDSNSWGKAGSNGATVKFTGLSETLNGNITVDSISSADIYLLEKSSYTGATSITENKDSSESLDSNITMNVSSDSKWIVTSDSTVTNLNVEEGGKIVDEDGKTVTIKNNGKTIVEGTSDYTVTVTGTYGTSFTTDEDNALSTNFIDRTEFDNTYNLSTTFSTNKNETVSEEEEEVEAEQSDDNSVVYVIAGVATAVVVGTIAYILLKKKK
jgi:trimeric autotransporter adhesin